MSEVMEKTFSSVSGFIMNSLGSRNMNVSPGFHNLIRSIRKARSKTEEEKAIQKELELLRLKLQQPDVSVDKIKEYLVRILYCELLGYPAGFSYICAIKLAQQGSLATKRVGYLAVCLFLHENHELILLLVNTLQRDLSSTNMLHNSMALTAVCKLIGAEMVPAVLPLVEEKLKHPKALVRKKAVLALRALYTKAPHMLQNPDALFKQALCDRDAAVTNAALYIHSDLIKENPAATKQLVRPLVAVLRQVTEHKLSTDFEYHGISAPWMQIRILRMLSRLGEADKHYSSLMYDLLDDMIQQTSALSHNIAYAVQYECLITVATIYPQEQLLIKAAKCISKFLKSLNYNLKYMGICALSAILKVLPSCAEEHQLTVIDCLDDADDTIKLKTLDLLFRMTTNANVEVICDRLLTFLQSTRDKFIRRDLLSKIVQLVDQYQPSMQWYLDTITKVLQTGGDLVPTNLANHVIAAIKTDMKRGDDIGQHALKLYRPLLSQTNTSNDLWQISCWVLGEFAHLPSAPPAMETIGILCSQLEQRRDDDDDDDMKIWPMAALTKVVASCGTVSADVTRAIEIGKKRSSMELRQRACELQQLCTDMDLMKEVYPKREPVEQLQFDWTLSFLDEYVSDALARGAAPYKSKQQRHAERQQASPEMKPMFSGLNFVPYQSPTPSLVCGTTTSISTPEGRTENKSVISEPSLSSGTSGNSAEPKMAESSMGLKLEGVKRVWGSHGYAKATPTTRSRTRSTTSDSQAPVSSSATPSSPARDVQPSVQLSSATALGRTTSSHPTTLNESSEEDSRKKELAKALFGGLQKSMTTSSKKPIDRKLPPAPAVERSPKSPEMPPSTEDCRDTNASPSSTDLLLLSDLDAPSSDRDPLQNELSETQYREENPDRTERCREVGDTHFEGLLGLTQEKTRHSTNPMHDSQPVINLSSSNPSEQLREAAALQTEEDQLSAAASVETHPSRPLNTAADRTRGQQPNMYEEFKGMDLSEEDSEAPKTNYNLLQDEGLVDHECLCATDPCGFPDKVHSTVQEPRKEKTNHRVENQVQVDENLPNNPEVKSNTNSANSPIRDESNSSVENSDLDLLETRISKSQIHPATIESSLEPATKGVSLLDSNPEDVSLRNRQELLQNSLPANWQDFPRGRERVELCNDTLLVVTLYKVWKPDVLGLVFNIANISQKGSITQLKIKLDVTSNLKVLDNPNLHPLSADNLDPSTTGILMAELGCVSPAPSMSLGGELAYRDHTKTHRRLFFSSPILVSDLLRPLELHTAEFGEQWPRLTRDCKFTVEVAAAVSMSKVMTLLTQELNLHLVEIIGNEGIACGTLLGGAICLLHAKLPTSKSLEVWVRSSSILLSESITKLCEDDALKKL